MNGRNDRSRMEGKRRCVDTAGAEEDELEADRCSDHDRCIDRGRRRQNRCGRGRDVPATGTAPLCLPPRPPSSAIPDQVSHGMQRPTPVKCGVVLGGPVRPSTPEGRGTPSGHQLTA